jgi:hypothetical protein
MTNPGIKLVRDFVRNPYAWPGGYPKYLVLQDGGVLCRHCTKSEYHLVCDAARAPEYRTGWEPVGVDINWEDSELTCDHCYARIECTCPPDEDEGATP